jgi:hypothetical protein
VRHAAIGRSLRSSEAAQEFQRTLHDREIGEREQEAYLEGVLGRRLIRERIALASRYLRPGDHVLDIECGDGTISRASAAQGAEVVAIDVSEEQGGAERFDLVTAFEGNAYSTASCSSIAWRPVLRRAATWRCRRPTGARSSDASRTGCAWCRYPAYAGSGLKRAGLWAVERLVYGKAASIVVPTQMIRDTVVQREISGWGIGFACSAGAKMRCASCPASTWWCSRRCTKPSAR